MYKQLIYQTVQFKTEILELMNNKKNIDSNELQNIFRELNRIDERLWGPFIRNTVIKRYDKENIKKVLFLE